MSARETFPTIREAEKTMATVNDFGKICSEGETTPYELAWNCYSYEFWLPGISFCYFWHCGFHFFATSSLIRSAKRPLNYVKSRAAHVRRFGSFWMSEKYWSAVENKFFRFLVMKSVLNVWEIAILSFKNLKGEKICKNLNKDQKVVCRIVCPFYEFLQIPKLHRHLLRSKVPQKLLLTMFKNNSEA